MSESNHAVVFGASGVAGWGVTNQLLSNYPTAGSFATLTAIANRPLMFEDSYWPAPSESTHSNLVSGVDLTEGTVEEFATKLFETIKYVKSVTHVFCFGYKQNNDPVEEVSTNCGMLKLAICAIEWLAPNLKMVVFPSGTKGYGIHLPSGRFEAPYTDIMRLSDMEGGDIWYHRFEDFLTEQSEGKKWTWCEIRPDAIIGFAPNGSAYNLIAHWALYLSTYALIEGNGAKVPYPGTEKGYKALYNEASADTIGKFAIWCALNPSKSSGQLFNIADSAKPGVGPAGDDEPAVLKPSKYLQRHKDVLEKWGIKTDIVFKGEFLDSYGYYLDFDRHLSSEKIRGKAGFEEEADPIVSWHKAFDTFKTAGMISM